MRDHAGRIALHYVCTYNGSKHQGRQLYAGAPVEATRIVRAHVARCTTSRAASPSRDVPEHSIAKSVRVRVCVVRCVFLHARARAHARHMCISVWRCSKLVPFGRQWPSRAVTVHSVAAQRLPLCPPRGAPGCRGDHNPRPHGHTTHTHTHTHTHAHAHAHTPRARAPAWACWPCQCVRDAARAFGGRG